MPNQRAFRPFAKQARELYDENLNLYTSLVLRRPLGKLMVRLSCSRMAEPEARQDFFAGLDILLKTTPPNEVGLHSTFTKKAARSATSSINGKDLRKAVEALAKRVDKHFNDVTNPSAENAQVIATVWRACQDEASRLIRSWRGLTERCYGDAVVLEVSTDDVDSAFARFKPGASA